MAQESGKINCIGNEHTKLRRCKVGGEFAGGTFDVTKLEAIETEKLTNKDVVSNIIDAGEKFRLRATFVGSGVGWPNVVNGCRFVAQFYAHGMGPGLPSLNLGAQTGNMAATGPTVVDSPMNVIAAEGLYRCGVTVTFQFKSGGPYYGVLGYNEDCVIQVSTHEEE